VATEFEKLMDSIRPQVDQLVAGATEHAKVGIRVFFERVTTNLSRAKRLLILHQGLSASAPLEARGTLDDLLRAVTVFLHATLEDFLRAIAEARLPHANNEVLNGIPLAGTSSSGRAEKFSLGQLTAHRGKTVDAVIEESVREHLTRVSFNSTGEIATVLKSASIDTKAVTKHFSVLDEMVRRRHQIVHQADSTALPDASVVLTPISYEEVDRWLTTAMAFTVDVLTELGVEAANANLFGQTKVRNPAV
jgi:RiboL-PSP-HEPN